MSDEDREVIPLAPLPPSCAWAHFCRDMPGLHQRIDDLGAVQMQIESRMVQMDQRDRYMAANLASLSSRQAEQGAQLAQILEALGNLAGSPSGFMTLTQEIKGSVGLTRRVFKWLIAIATGAGAIYGVFHLNESKGEPADPTQQEMRVGE